MSAPAAPTPPQYGVSPAWAPPPKPGLLPLRPLTFGQLLGTPFQVIRRNGRSLIGPAVLIQVVSTLSSVLVMGVVVGVFADRMARASGSDESAIIAGGIAAIVLAALVALAISITGSGFLQGVVVIDVANGALGHRPRAGQLWRATHGRRWALAGYLALMAAGYFLAFVILGGIVAALIAGGTASSGGGRTALITIGIVFGIVGGLGFLVLVAWVWTKTSLAGAAIMLERLGVRTGIARSWALTRGGFWRVFGAQILVILICNVATQLISTPLAFVFEFAFTLAFPTGTPTSFADSDVTLVVVAAASYGLLLLFSLVIGAVTAVIQSSAAVVVYIDQRMRREGLDLVLARYVEDRQTGRPLGDPFATPEFGTGIR
jgi:hypothetical protein